MGKEQVVKCEELTKVNQEEHLDSPHVKAIVPLNTHIPSVLLSRRTGQQAQNQFTKFLDAMRKLHTEDN